MTRCVHCFLLCVALLSLAGLQQARAGELLLGFNGKSGYQLVTPPATGDKAIDDSIEQATKLMVEAFAAQEITLPVVAEAGHDPARPSIYLGNTKYAQAQGVTFKPDSGWTMTFKVVGRNLIIAGNDQPDPIALGNRAQRNARWGGKPLLGTYKATTEFLYRYVGTRFLVPGEMGIVHMPTPIIFVPDDLNFTHRPWARQAAVYRATDPYTIANGFEPAPRWFTYYGHYHGTVFTKQDEKEHPEYFILRAGKRQPHTQHYCFSNPQVRQRIYQKVLEDVDKGFDVIEMGQNDGFIPCGCEKCYNLYGVHPTTPPEAGRAYLMDAAWGEKLWIMHRDMALQLQKDRPHAKLMISAYSVARNPPTTFDSLPENVIVQIMRPEPEIMKAWQRIDVPGGFSGYLYLWGSFPLSGYTPRRSRFDMEQQIQLILKHDMNLIQNNGKPVNHGIEGINIYVYGRYLNDPTYKTTDELYDEYIRAAYQEAAGPMASFYRKLHQRLVFMDQAMRYGRELNRNPLLLYNTLYTPDLINELEQQIKSAQKLAKHYDVQQRLANTAMEFEFLKQIATIVTLYHAWQAEPSAESHHRVIDAVEARNQWLATLPELSEKNPGIARFWDRKVQAYKVNGRYMNIAPFNWDIQARRSMKQEEAKVEIADISVAQARSRVAIDSPQWRDQPVHELRSSMRNANPLREKTTFQLLYDKENLYVRVVASLPAEHMNVQPRGRDAEIWLQESINIQLSPTGDRSQYFYLSYEPVADSFSDAEHGFITDPLHPRFGWNDATWDGDWQYVNHLDKEKGVWTSMATIPFKTLRAQPPASGSVWAINVARVHYFDKKTSENKTADIRELSMWAQDLNISLTPGDGHFGGLIFE